MKQIEITPEKIAEIRIWAEGCLNIVTSKPPFEIEAMFHTADAYREIIALCDTTAQMLAKNDLIIERLEAIDARLESAANILSAEPIRPCPSND